MAVLQELVFSTAQVFAKVASENKRDQYRHKKTARLGWRFFGKLGFYDNYSPLSIRQRPEISKKVKIKLGGHGVSSRCQKVRTTL
jgi:hypothetical protein